MSRHPGFRQTVVEPFKQDVAGWQRRGWFGDARPPRTAFLVLRYNGLRATLLHRLAYWATVRRVPMLAGLLANLNLSLHGIEMTPHVPVGPGLYLPHTVGTVINARSIGANVEIQSCVTVGLKDLAEFPVIHDNVQLAAGCRVLGNICLGSGVRVGANAVVLNDVDPGQTVVGVPARPIGAKA
ncbi:MAG: serine acetyltransferase [Dehalococcoidia bacterium]|nr:serine acetyltransferase [Dehalococcoidia bacterium]